MDVTEMKDEYITIRIVTGGFILTTGTSYGDKTAEVFLAEGKLLKAIRGHIELIKASKNDEFIKE